MYQLYMQIYFEYCARGTYEYDLNIPDESHADRLRGRG